MLLFRDRKPHTVCPHTELPVACPTSPVGEAHIPGSQASGGCEPRICAVRRILRLGVGPGGGPQPFPAGEPAVLGVHPGGGDSPCRPTECVCPWPSLELFLRTCLQPCSVSEAQMGRAIEGP